MQTALLVTELVCPASKEISTLDTITDAFRSRKLLPVLIGIVFGTLAVGLAVGLLLLLTVRFRQGTPTHNLLSEKHQRLVISDRRNNGKGLVLIFLSYLCNNTMIAASFFIMVASCIPATRCSVGCLQGALFKTGARA